jgi:diguanylate cyclase (GGDEF)-like protein/PAS domain S-box-containing protein
VGDGSDSYEQRTFEAVRDTLLDVLPVGVFFADATGSCIFVNDRFCEITRKPREQLLGRGYEDSVHPEDRADMFPRWREAVEVGRFGGGEIRFVDGDDTTVWASIQVAPIIVEGATTGFLATALDVTARRSLEQDRDDQEVFLHAIRDRAPIGICLVAPDGTAVSANQRMVEILGSDPTGRNLVDFVYPDDLEIAVNTSVQAIMEERTDYQFSVRFPRPDGSLRHADVHCQAVLDGAGAIRSSLIAVVDITDIVDARRESERYSEMLAALTDFVALCDPRGEVIYLNRVAEIHERDLPVVGKRKLADFFDASSRGRLVSEGWSDLLEHGLWQGELTLACAPGITTPVSVSLTANEHADGERTVSVVARDITDIKAAQKALEIQATHDPLTGLPNRALLFDRVENALERNVRSDRPVVLMFVDLDGFKQVNDQYGHDVGDEVLRGVASRLLDVVRLGDTVARIGGDEFVVLSEGMPEPDVALGVAERIVYRITEPFAVGGALASIGASVGVAFAGPMSTVSGIVKQADLAVYEAKRTGKGRVVVFDEGLRRSA